MDELFDRIKSIKIKHKTLVITLILTEILGILVLVWFLRVPLSQKFLTTPPKAYSVVSMNPKKQYLLSQGDFLTGQAIPNTQVKVLIKPGDNKTKVTASPQGEWRYQIPTELPVNIYQISFGNFDKTNKLVTLQSYKFRLESNVWPIRSVNSLLKQASGLLQLKKVSAQNTLAANYYATLGLPNPTNQIQLTEDEKFRLINYFLPFAYPMAERFSTDWKLMAMWIYTESVGITNYMDNCLDGNPDWGEDADLNQNTPCTGWGEEGMPNWQVGWGIFPFQWVDELEEAIAITHPGETIQQIGQKVIDDSKDETRYPTTGNSRFKPPNDPITDPEIFPDDVTLKEIIEGAKPVGGGDRGKTCRPDDKPKEEGGHANPLEDPKDCYMRQLLGILMKDPSISAYFLAKFWRNLDGKGPLGTTIKTWGSAYVNGRPSNLYADMQKVSDTIAAINEAASGIDLEAIKFTPSVNLPIVMSVPPPIEDPVYPIDSLNPSGYVYARPVVSIGGEEIEINPGHQKVIIVIIPRGTNPIDFGLGANPGNFEYNPTPERNVKGINTDNNETQMLILGDGLNCSPDCTVNITDPQILSFPQDYDFCAGLAPDNLNVFISVSCLSLSDILEPQIPDDLNYRITLAPELSQEIPLEPEIVNEMETIQPTAQDQDSEQPQNELQQETEYIDVPLEGF